MTTSITELAKKHVSDTILTDLGLSRLEQPPELGLENPRARSYAAGCQLMHNWIIFIIKAELKKHVEEFDRMCHLTPVATDHELAQQGGRIDALRRIGGLAQAIIS